MWELKSISTPLLLSICLPMYLFRYKILFLGAWIAQSVKGSTVDFGSGHVSGSWDEPRMGLVLGMESGILSLPSPSLSVHPVPLLKTNKTNKTNQTKKLFSVLKNNFFFIRSFKPLPGLQTKDSQGGRGNGGETSNCKE